MSLFSKMNDDTMLDDSWQNRGADFLRFFLTPFVCFWAFGFPDGLGLVTSLSGFAIPAFFILTGYFVLVPEKDQRTEKLKSAITRCLITLGALFLVYMAVNILWMEHNKVLWAPQLMQKRVLFNFLILNVWPFSIGNNIWFIQALLYAYVFLLLLNNIGLLRFYKILLALSALVMVLLGELAGVIGFNFHGYTFIPGGAFTRALPYVLLGMLLREKSERLKTIKGWQYILAFVIGAGLGVGELFLLVKLGKLIYEGHMLGYGVMAAALCAWAVSHPQMPRSIFTIDGHYVAKLSYYVANPLYNILIIALNWILPKYTWIIVAFGGIIVYLLCLLAAVVWRQIRKIF